MKFSVLMSVYKSDNPTDFETALRSVTLDQTIKPDQVVLVVDGPVHPSIEHVIQAFGFPLKVVRLAENAGLSHALDVGMRHCEHDLVFRMDSDDISEPNRFNLQLQFFSRHPDAHLVSTSYTCFDDKTGVVGGARDLPATPGKLREYARFRTPVNHPSLGFRKSFVDGCGGYPSTRLPFEDWWLALRVLKHGGNIYNMSEPLVKVRTGEAFYSRRSGASYAKAEFLALRSFYDEGLMARKDFLVNLAIRLPSRFLPNRILNLVYARFLRS